MQPNGLLIAAHSLPYRRWSKGSMYNNVYRVSNKNNIYIYIKPYYAHLLPQVGKSFTRFNTDKQSNREQS